ncbi:hypothetical protein NQZ68_042025 [Dissostichus eleginoides]|nr:hypothetical protein NQZ68_042025 [Dissostichus eleginoides]
MPGNNTTDQSWAPRSEFRPLPKEKLAEQEEENQEEEEEKEMPLNNRNCGCDARPKRPLWIIFHIAGGRNDRDVFHILGLHLLGGIWRAEQKTELYKSSCNLKFSTQVRSHPMERSRFEPEEPHHVEAAECAGCPQSKNIQVK